MSLSKSNYVEVDPLDPKRMIVQGEDLFPFITSKITTVHTIKKGSVDAKKLDAAFEKFCEWYPVVGLTSELRSDGHHYFTEGKIRPFDFAQDLKNNEVITTKKQLQNFISRAFDQSHHDRYLYNPRLYKVNMKPGEGDSFMNDDVGYILLHPVDHLIMDGKAHETARNFINSYFADKNYRPNIASPQTVVNNPHVLIPTDIEPKPLPQFPGGEIQSLDYDKNIKVDTYRRSINACMRRYKKSDFKRPKQYSFTVAMSGVDAFIYTSLLLDTEPSLDTAATCLVCPYTMDHTGFMNVVEGDYTQLCGNDVGIARTYQSTSRTSPKTLYQIMALTKEHHDFTRKYITQNLVNQRYGPFYPTNKKPGKEMLQNVVTNMGNNKLVPGPLQYRSGFTFPKHNVGGSTIALMGQIDGTISVSMIGHKTSFPPRFLELYQQLVINILSISERRNVTRDELITLPEYKELVRILRP